MNFPDQKCAVIGLRFFPLFSADVCGEGACDEPLRTSAWEAPWYPEEQFPESKRLWCLLKALMVPRKRPHLYEISLQCRSFNFLIYVVFCKG